MMALQVAAASWCSSNDSYPRTAAAPSRSGKISAYDITNIIIVSVRTR